MSLTEWYQSREVLLTGVTSELGQALLEKLLRTFPSVTVYTIVRSRNSLLRGDRIKKIFSSAGFSRLRNEQPNAISRVKVFEGNLLYNGLGLNADDLKSLREVKIVFHAAGPYNNVLNFGRDELPQLEVIALASNMFKNKTIFDDKHPDIKKFEDIPLTVIQHSALSPAYLEPVPGLAETLNGPTALMIGAGYTLGKKDLQAEVIPIDSTVNGLITAAWERGTRKDGNVLIYNVPNLGCTWAELLKKSQTARKKFPYPAFGISGMTSIVLLHWIVIFFFEWLPSAICDSVLSAVGAKPRFGIEHRKVRDALKSMESVCSKSVTIDRTGVDNLEKRLSQEDREKFPVCFNIDLEFYAVCVAASAQKHCPNKENIFWVKNLKRIFVALISVVFLYNVLGK
ncbi:fatty acyl-CoA reductase 1-like [Chelonus insularis]|uniref:fatty acyl-CoA reductase 1-like n=1 Tax=Chelonus insularis TaxID=460826 RepID=UPI00158C5154|nr:fatty acyl-CoA reductase 1-like [Chelonus insularis]